MHLTKLGYLLLVSLIFSSCAHLMEKPDDTLVVDHILYAGPTLENLSLKIFAETGIQPKKGGRHPDLGTWNEIVSLGPDSYLELIAPDPTGKLSGGAKVLGLGDLKAPKTVAWAAMVKDLDLLHQRFAKSHIQTTQILTGSRVNEHNGQTSKWRYFFITDSRYSEVPRLIPFFIQYDSDRMNLEFPGCSLKSLKGFHPTPEKFAEFSQVINMKMDIQKKTESSLQLTLTCPKGTVVLE